ncbi:PHD finger protein 20-like [Genypterus blacodes]|uniref:PHD finger protein 20-like n=1 Tax=Genypterus blacodes TaxID=154954 RepID=UPI003F761E75
MKTPPDRSGITFEVGAQLEARDSHKNWYRATIEKIDYDKEEVLIHYRQWSRRHDEWFSWNSQYLRPVERVSLRRRGLKQPRPQTQFGAGSKVMACWTDCRFYPARILKVNKEDSYTVRFYDGVVQTVKPTKVKPFQEQQVLPETSTVGSEGWEEGESEEEEGGEGEEDNMDERKRKSEPTLSPSPAKRKTDDSGSSIGLNEPITAGSAHPAPPDPAHTDRDVLLERQSHLPTTHKFSREPLYRVIKNQPPPILSIELDHNPFKCAVSGCSKSFRKASMLHYHIKYYHSESPQPGGQQGALRKQSTSQGEDFLTDRKNDDQNVNICHHDNGEHSTTATEETKEGGKERKERKNFLRIKLKKKKKKKKKKKTNQSGRCSSDEEKSDGPHPLLRLSTGHQDTHAHTQADDGSDWSTLTAESGEDTPPWPITMETEECEVVRCVCEVDEENDFMIQCEACCRWQHGTCMGLYEDNVPHNYTCYYCRDTAGWRRAQCVLSEPDWLISGHMFGLSCVRENYSQVNASHISHTSRLLAHTHGLNQVLSGLQLKVSLLHSPMQPDLQLWRLPWKQEEGLRLAESQKGEVSICYVSSEHCYQKPGASWEKAEERGKEAQAAGVKPRPLQDVNSHTHPEPRPVCVSHCQLNLLEHVECLHAHITGRMDEIERELDVLESCLDHSGELEPPDPLSRLPQLKERIRRLLCDLLTVRNLSVCR